MARVWPFWVSVRKMLVSGFFFSVVEKGGGSGPLGPPLWIRPCLTTLFNIIVGQIQIQIQIHLFGHIADPGDLC